MALRVLLADESSTIKRVIQLALQDYAVEVKSVPIGLDVLPEVKLFKPDVIFADVFLPKRNGYEVCEDLKKDPSTQKIPVILMWSGFMDLDQKKASQCRSDGRLEKPFETEQLRTLVQSLVPQLKSNPISPFLKFPKLPDFAEEPKLLTPTLPATSTDTEEQFNIDAIPEMAIDEEFQQIPLHKTPQKIPSKTEEMTFNVPAASAEDNEWSKHDINQFKLILPSEKTSPGIEKSRGDFSNVIHNFSKNSEPPSQSSSFSPVEEHSMELNHSGSFEEIIYDAPKPSLSTNGPTALDIALTEKVIREEAQKMLESMIWKILPNIAERVVREEINKLLQETEKSI